MVSTEKFVLDSGDDVANLAKVGVYDDNNSTYVLSAKNLLDFDLVGIRMEDVDVPQGTQITSATLKIRLSLTGITAPKIFDIYGVDEDNANDWASTTNEPKDATKTTAVYNFSQIGEFGEQFFGLPVTNIVQEILDRGSWSSGNAMGFLLDGLQHSGDRRAECRFYTYDEDSANAASITIVYPGGTFFKINIGNLWKEVSGIKININNVWKDIEGAQINIGGTWKNIF